MRMLSTLALGAALSVAALPALAQSGTGAGPSPGTSTAQPNAAAQPNSGVNSSTTITNERAPPAGPSGSRALTPGQNADGTPTNQSPGGQPQLPGMKGQGK